MSSEAPELKPCPFCGENMGVEGDWFDHQRNDCVLSGYVFFIRADTQKWNRRADLPWLPEELVKRGQQAIYKWEKYQNCEACARLLREFIAAVEQKP